MQTYVKTWFVDCRSLIVECNKGQSERRVGRERGEITGYIYYLEGDTRLGSIACKGSDSYANII